MRTAGETTKYRVERAWRQSGVDRRTVSEGLTVSENRLAKSRIRD